MCSARMDSPSNGAVIRSPLRNLDESDARTMIYVINMAMRRFLICSREWILFTVRKKITKYSKYFSTKKKPVSGEVTFPSIIPLAVEIRQTRI